MQVQTQQELQRAPTGAMHMQWVHVQCIYLIAACIIHWPTLMCSAEFSGETRPAQHKQKQHWYGPCQGWCLGGCWWCWCDAISAPTWRRGVFSQPCQWGIHTATNVHWLYQQMVWDSFPRDKWTSLICFQEMAWFLNVKWWCGAPDAAMEKLVTRSHWRFSFVQGPWPTHFTGWRFWTVAHWGH